ncbi:MAG: acyl-CoA dehydrogenase family protein [Polyangiaceae bacterium]|nr:acyl-CoA dehydrogenase family protein [Polyangiaceae bacterium]
MIDFQLTDKQRQLKDALEGLGRHVVRPQSLAWDRDHTVSEAFLRQFMGMARAFAGEGSAERFLGTGEEPGAGHGADRGAPRGKPSQANRTAAVGAEALAWCDAALLLAMPGPGLGGPPVRSTGTPEQRQRFFGIFKDMSQELRWGAYGLTEPGAGSDVAAIRTTCVKDGDAWVLNGRKCYITNGARAAWTVIFATVDHRLGRAGHRAFVVEKGTPGFSVGKIEDKMGLRASETAELVLEDCRVPEANLLGGADAHASKEGFMTAMKTFDTTRPLVGAMACGIGRAAYEHARYFVRERYLLSRPIPRYAALAERLARVGRRLEAARALVHHAVYLADLEQQNAKEASMAKAYAGQAAVHACTEAIDLCGAHGTLAGSDQLLEKWFRDIKVFDIFEGTGNIQRVVIAKRIVSGLKAF